MMTKRTLTGFVLTTGLSLAGVGSAQVSGLTTLQQLRDRARPLLIFAPKPDDPQLEIQLRTLREHEAEASERQLVPVAVPYNSPSPTRAQLGPQEALEVRRRFHIAPEQFAVILIGKDGGAKLRSTKPFAMQKLVDTIDAMPMRQDEMRKSTGE